MEFCINNYDEVLRSLGSNGKRFKERGLKCRPGHTRLDYDNLSLDGCEDRRHNREVDLDNAWIKKRIIDQRNICYICGGPLLNVRMNPMNPMHKHPNLPFSMKDNAILACKKCNMKLEL